MSAVRSGHSWKQPGLLGLDPDDGLLALKLGEPREQTAADVREGLTKLSARLNPNLLFLGPALCNPASPLFSDPLLLNRISVCWVWRFWLCSLDLRGTSCQVVLDPRDELVSAGPDQTRDQVQVWCSWARWRKRPSVFIYICLDLLQFNYIYIYYKLF